MTGNDHKMAHGKCSVEIVCLPKSISRDVVGDFQLIYCGMLTK